MTPLRLLFFTDLHARGTSPRSRRDNYAEAMFRKLAELRTLADQHQVKAVLFGGDLTDIPVVSESIEVSLITTLQDFGCPVEGVNGNTHDIKGDNINTLNQTALGVVVAAKAMHLLRPGEPVFLEEDGVKVQITGQGYHEDMDRRDRRLDYCVYHEGSPLAPEGHQHWRAPDTTWAIHIVHGMLRTTPLMEEVPVTIVRDVLDVTQANITLSGHDHLGYGVVQQSGRFACNPGALMRLTAAREEIARPVQVALITLTATDCQIELIPLQSAAPGEEVLDRTKIEADKARKAALEDFSANLTTGGQLEALDLSTIVDQVAGNKHVNAKVKAKALYFIRQAIEAQAAEEAANA